jgi:hypothetical protein
MMSRLMAAVSGMVRGTLLRGARSGRRQRRTWSTEAVECRCLLSGTAIGDLVQTYPVTVQFSEFGHFGDARVFGDTLFIPGTRNDGAPIAWMANLRTGGSEILSFGGTGNVSGVFLLNGERIFTGTKNRPSGSSIVFWGGDGTEKVVKDITADIFDVDFGGTVVGTQGYSLGLTYKFGVEDDPFLHGLQDLSVAFHSITNDGLFIGGGASDFDFNTRGVVYKRSADGLYALLNDQFFTPDGKSLLRLDVAESSIGVLGVGVYAIETGARRTGLWKLDGTYLGDAGVGYVTGAKFVGNYMFVTTDSGHNVTAIDLKTFQTQSFTGDALFGTDVEFEPGSVFATEDGHLGLIGRNPVTGFLTVKTFEVPQNTAPVVSAWDGTAAFVENAQPVVLDANALVSDGDSSDFAGGSVTVSVVSHGEAADRLNVRHVGNSAGRIGVSGNGISYGGVLIGTMTGGSNGSTPLVVTLNSAANAQSVTALLRAVTFQNVSDSPSTQTRQVQVTVADGDGGSSAAVTKAVSVTAVNDAPVILAFDGSVTYTENAVPVLLDTNASASDADGLNIGGGLLHIMITANGQSTDRLAIRNVGTGAGQISVSGNAIKLGNVICATFTGGTSGSSPLVVTFAPAATTASATSILRALTFASVSENPSVLPRTIRVLMTDNVGKFSAPVFKTVTVVAVNDAPVIAAFDGSVTYTENAVPVLLDSNASASDADGVNIGGGLLHIMITANGQASDRLAIRNVGTGAGQISVTGNTIKLGNVICATFTGGTSGSSPLVVTLAPSATTASATSILRALTFASVSENPSVLPRTIRVLMTDNVGKFSAPVFKTVTVVAVNDAPVISSWDSPLSTVGNANPILLDSSAAVTDVDSSNFSGGTLTLWISANGHGFDRLAVRSVGNSTGQIGVSGSSVRFGGVLIGTFIGGTSGTVPLVVTLNGSSTPAAVTALLRSLTYKFAGTSPARVVKTVRVSLSDGDGGTSSSVAKLLTLERTL